MAYVRTRLIAHEISDVTNNRIGGKSCEVRLYGKDAEGTTCAVIVHGFRPFFLCSLPASWSEDLQDLLDDEEGIPSSETELGGMLLTVADAVVNGNQREGAIQGTEEEEHAWAEERRELYHKGTIQIEPMQGRDLYGYKDPESVEELFIKMSFESVAAMNRAKKLWAPGSNAKMVFEYEDAEIGLYEGSVPPLLRFFHERNLNPSGWIQIATEDADSLVHSADVLAAEEAEAAARQALEDAKAGIPKGADERATRKVIDPYRSAYQEAQRKALRIGNMFKTQCETEVRCDYRCIDPCTGAQADVPVPYKICSFDIEASSASGEFPRAKKDYRRVAEGIVDAWAELDTKRLSVPDLEARLRTMVEAAFGLNDAHPDMPKAYPKKKPKATSKEWQDRLKSFLENKKVVRYAKTASKDVPLYNARGIEDDEGDTVAPRKKQRSTAVPPRTPVLILGDSKIPRSDKVDFIAQQLGGSMPEQEGDKITFIGSTFTTYGSTEPPRSICQAVGETDDIAGVEVIRHTGPNPEKEMIKRWARLIREEDPDIIVGYNIFGFDYAFMMGRAFACNCVKDFMYLSRRRSYIPRQYDHRTKTSRIDLEQSTLVIASGEHQLSYPAMEGRVQIDLYNFLRRDYQLSQYKLDYVAGHFIGDVISSSETLPGGGTVLRTSNTIGLETGAYVTIEEHAHSVEPYKDGQKFQVRSIDRENGAVVIETTEVLAPDRQWRWGLAKDDVSPQQIFALAEEGPRGRAIVAKYCVQDCNLVHHLMRKIDVITGYIEMSALCSVPMSYLVLRGQGIKLTSYICKKCNEKGYFMPTLSKVEPRSEVAFKRQRWKANGLSERPGGEAYEGAIVLDPKCGLYVDDPVACVDFSSLYPSAIISENISMDTKIQIIDKDLKGRVLRRVPETVKAPPGHRLLEIEYDCYEWVKKSNSPSAANVKKKVGSRVCVFVQKKIERDETGRVVSETGVGVMPAILQELLAARKETRRLAKTIDDPFMKNVLDKRQLSIKITANSLYGQTGAKTSTFYELDCAASTTAVGRRLLTWARRSIETAYANKIVQVEGRDIHVNAEYVYGDTDSVFFKFNMSNLDGTKIVGREALRLTIPLAKEAGKLATQPLKSPHDLEYEKTFWPFLLLSKKRYVGILHEDDPEKGKRKSMGIVLKRRDNAPIVKDVYGGVIDILMKGGKAGSASEFLNEALGRIVAGETPMAKLIITKSLRSGYKNPKQISHNVLAERIGRRDPGNKPKPGDRVAFAFFANPTKGALQGDKIETPEYIVQNKLPIDYAHYITNQLMKPLQQVFALILEDLPEFKKRYTESGWRDKLEETRRAHIHKGEEAVYKKEEALRNKEVKALLFQRHLTAAKSRQAGNAALG